MRLPLWIEACRMLRKANSPVPVHYYNLPAIFKDFNNIHLIFNIPVRLYPLQLSFLFKTANHELL